MAGLTDEEISIALQSLPGWQYQDSALSKTYTMNSFSDAIALVNGAAECAEELGHHPDMNIRYNRVYFYTQTHDAGNVVTDKDIKLASEIERVNAGLTETSADLQ